MKKTQFSEQQMVKILREADAVCRSDERTHYSGAELSKLIFSSVQGHFRLPMVSYRESYC
jgi:hypothetical protein